MRLFVAIELNDDVREVAETTADQLRTRLGRVLSARWVPTANLHLTVRFIGHVPDDQVPSLIGTLRPPLPLAPFSLTLGDCGAFPARRAPRAPWIGLAQGLPSLQAMHAEFNRRLVPCGFQPEVRPFTAHLTLARIKDAPRGSGTAVGEAMRVVRVPSVQCRVAEAVVFESRPSPKGTHYLPQLRIPLRT